MSTSVHWRPIKRRRLRSPSQPRTNSGGSHSIHILNDDVLLNIFYVYRIDITDDTDEEDEENFRSVPKWDRQRWWYKPAQVCRRWRQLILAFPYRLDIHLLCTYGVPVAEMLAHSPPLPLTVFYDDYNRKMTTKDEEGALLALGHRDRLRHVALWMRAHELGKFIAVMDEEFPVLERMFFRVGPPYRDERSARLAFPKGFRAPNLRHVWTSYLPIPSPLPANTTCLAILRLIDIPASAHFPPSYILTRLSHMPQLETLVIRFHSPVPNRDVTRQLLDTPFTAEVTLPHLRVFSFRGVSAYLEGLLARISAPALNFLDVQFFHQLTFTAPHLSQFIQASNNPRCSTAKFTFDEDSVDFKLFAGPHQSLWQRPLRLRIICRHLDWQVASVMQILSTLSPILSVVEELTLSHMAYNRSLGSPAEVYGKWRELFRPFRGVKILQVPRAPFGEPPWSLHPRSEKIFLEFMPKLLKINHSPSERNPFIRPQRFDPFPSIGPQDFKGFIPSWYCPGCPLIRPYLRKPDLHRHLLSVHLPYWIHCPYPPCSWRGTNIHGLEGHLKRQKCGPDRLEREQYEIYKTNTAIDGIINGGKTIQEMARCALVVVEERARELGKVEEWSNLWGRGGRRQRSSLTTAASPPF